MAKRIGKVKLNSRGIQAIMKSAGVKADLDRRARRIAAAAGPGVEAKPAESGAERARAAVVTTTYQGRLNEARDRRLSRAIDAGRG